MDIRVILAWGVVVVAAVNWIVTLFSSEEGLDSIRQRTSAAAYARYHRIWATVLLLLMVSIFGHELGWF